MHLFILLSSTSPFSSTALVIAGSLIVIISYLFNLVAKRYSIPSVLMLIFLGMALHYEFSHNYSEYRIPG